MSKKASGTLSGFFTSPAARVKNGGQSATRQGGRKNGFAHGAVFCRGYVSCILLPMGVFIARFLITALAFLLAAELVPGIMVADFYTALILALFWGIIGLTIRPLLFILTLPINFLTFGLFTLIINGFLFWFLSTFVQGFAVDGFSSAFLGAVVISVISWLGGKFIAAIK